MKKILYLNILSFIITYISLIYQRYILVDRIVVDKLEKVEVIAGGFPLQFLVDGYISPVGSIGIDPLSLIVGLDQFIFLYFIFDYSFWLVCILACCLFLRKVKVK